MEVPTAISGDSVRFNYSFALSEFDGAIDQGQLRAEEPADNGGFGRRIAVPAQGFPLETGRRGMLFSVSGEPGPRQGDATGIMVGDEHHFRNVPPIPSVRMHSGCSFSILGRTITFQLMELSRKPSSDRDLLDHVRMMIGEFNLRYSQPDTDCDCRAQGRAGLRSILEKGGIFFDLYEQEGRGHGLMTKLAILDRLQYGRNTAEACEDLGLEWDVRDYSHCARALTEWGITEVMLLTNNPRKHQGLQVGGITTHPAPHVHGVTPDNLMYLLVKAAQGHEFSPEELAMLAAQAQDCWPSASDQQTLNSA